MSCDLTNSKDQSYQQSLRDRNKIANEEIFLKIMHLHNDLYGHGHDTYNFGTPFLGFLYYILGLSDQCLGVEEKIF